MVPFEGLLATAAAQASAGQWLAARAAVEATAEAAAGTALCSTEWVPAKVLLGRSMSARGACQGSPPPRPPLSKTTIANETPATRQQHSLQRSGSS